MLFILGALTGGCCTIRCKPAFDNFGPGQTYQLAGNEAVQGSAAQGGYNGTANAFVPLRSGRLCRVFVATGLKSGSNAVDLQLMNDGGNRPAGVLESWHLTNKMARFGTQSAPVKACSSKHPWVQAGRQYWMVALALGSRRREGTTGRVERMD
jgi:hypothetical protein